MFTHGTKSGYNKHGCRCSECSLAQRKKICTRCGEPCSGSVCRACRQMARMRQCDQCGVEFEASARASRFCSRACCAASLRGTGRGGRAPSKTRRDWRSRRSPGLSESERRQLLARWRRQGLACAYCSGPCETVDHVVPLIRGGTNFEGNLTPACRRCNSSKCDRLITEWRNGRPGGSTIQRQWREPERRPHRTIEVRGVQTSLDVCYICGALFAAPTSRAQVTCGSKRCQREHTGRHTREAYRAKVGLPSGWDEPTSYWGKSGPIVR